MALRLIHHWAMYIAMLLSLFFSLSGLAAPCVDSPRAVVSTGPRLVATGLPFTLNFRFNCDLAPRFRALFAEGAYVSEGADPLLADRFLYTFPLPSGEVLYQAPFYVPQAQPPGLYAFRGCIRVQENATGNVTCVALPDHQTEVVGVPGF